MMKLGLQGRLYRNAGSYEAPDWVLVPAVAELTLSLELSEADVSARRSRGWRATRGALKEASVEFQMLCAAADPNLRAIEEAYQQHAPLDCAILDGPIGAAGVEGLRAMMDVLKISRGEGKDDAMTIDVVLKPTYAPHRPQWLTAEEIDGGLFTTQQFDEIVDGGPLVDPQFEEVIDGGGF